MTIKSENFYKFTFKNATFVIKISGKVLSNLAALEALLADIKTLQDSGIKIIIVCGFGMQLDLLSKQIYNKEPQKINGRRITGSDDIECAKMVCGKIMCDIASIMTKQKTFFTSCMPISKDIVSISRRQISEYDFGFVGDVISVNSTSLNNIIEQNMVLVMPSLGVDAKSGEVLNINADTTATKIAAAIGAEKIIFVSDVEFVKDKEGNRISVIKAHDIPDMIAHGVVKDGMIVKLENAKNAVDLGVAKAHIVSGLKQGAILEELLSENGVGTVIQGHETSYDY